MTKLSIFYMEVTLGFFLVIKGFRSPTSMWSLAGTFVFYFSTYLDKRILGVAEIFTGFLCLMSHITKNFEGPLNRHWAF